MNTFGLFSVNSGTFNIKYFDLDSQKSFSHFIETGLANFFVFGLKEGLRNIMVTGLRIHNLVLNILGYLGGQIGFVSGCVRIGTGLSMIVTTLKIGDREDAEKGSIIQHWYGEALITGVAQIARGILEVFVPYGRIVNGSLDLICTAVNLKSKFEVSRLRSEDPNDRSPHEDTQYPLPLSFLSLV